MDKEVNKMQVQILVTMTGNGRVTDVVNDAMREIAVSTLKIDNMNHNLTRTEVLSITYNEHNND
jgi:hypothetical protein